MSLQTLRKNRNEVAETAATAFVLTVRNPHYFPNITAAASLPSAAAPSTRIVFEHSKNHIRSYGEVHHLVGTVVHTNHNFLSEPPCHSGKTLQIILRLVGAAYESLPTFCYNFALFII